MDIKYVTLGLVLICLLVNNGCQVKPQIEYHTFESPLSPQQSEQLWLNNCQQSRSTGCIQVKVQNDPDGNPIERAIVIIQGEGGMSGYTNADGLYRWSGILPGIHSVQVAIIQSNSSISDVQEQQAEVKIGEITYFKFVFHPY